MFYIKYVLMEKLPKAVSKPLRITADFLTLYKLLSGEAFEDAEELYGTLVQFAAVQTLASQTMLLL